MGAVGAGASAAWSTSAGTVTPAARQKPTTIAEAFGYRWSISRRNDRSKNTLSGPGRLGTSEVIRVGVGSGSCIMARKSSNPVS